MMMPPPSPVNDPTNPANSDPQNTTAVSSEMVKVATPSECGQAPSFCCCFRTMNSAVRSPDCTGPTEKHQVIERLDLAGAYVDHLESESPPANWRELARAEVLVSSGRPNVVKFIAGRTDIARSAQTNRLHTTMRIGFACTRLEVTESASDLADSECQRFAFTRH